MWGQWVGGGVESISMNRPSHHKFRSPKQVLLIACLITSGLNGSKKLYAYWVLPFDPDSENESHMSQTQNRPSEKLHIRDK